MCTVSHCREILPPNYGFLRCERHRIQNRHHSRLKRVRDKESKAQALEGWAAAVGIHTGGTRGSSEELDDDADSMLDEEEEHDGAAGMTGMESQVSAEFSHARRHALRDDRASHLNLTPIIAGYSSGSTRNASNEPRVFDQGLPQPALAQQSVEDV